VKIILNNAGKRYNRDWIFRNINYEFTSDHAYVILGANGSGKSTLLQLLAGNIMPSEGTVSYQDNTKKVIDNENIYQQLSFASPYLELFEEYTLKESVELHSKFKKFRNDMGVKEVIAAMELESSIDKALKNFSSGMKQRVRLALAILSDTRLLLLDEPASNLDPTAIEWYQQLVKEHSNNRLIVVCSNQQKEEYTFCDQQLQVEDYKQK